MKKLATSLKTLLSDVVTMYFAAHGYHWNVEGEDFYQYHELFAEIYEDVYSSVDPLAENIRKLDEYAPFSFKTFLDLRTIETKEVKPEPKAMAKALMTLNEGVIKSLNKAFKDATSADEQGIADFIAGRIDQHQKWAWQLRASTK
jgi:starvation-inducible DNA-binding protein